jgi:type VI protein secretion system component Hcp
MSQTRYSWKIDNFIAPGTPLTGILLSLTWEAYGSSSIQFPVQKKESIEFYVERSQDDHTFQFTHYAISGRQIKRMTIQLEKISDKGALLSRTTYSFSDIEVIDIETFEGKKNYTNRLRFKSPAVSISNYKK